MKKRREIFFPRFSPQSVLQSTFFYSLATCKSNLLAICNTSPISKIPYGRNHFSWLYKTLWKYLEIVSKSASCQWNTLYIYSQVSNKRGAYNKRGGWGKKIHPPRFLLKHNNCMFNPLRHKKLIKDLTNN